MKNIAAIEVKERYIVISESGQRNDLLSIVEDTKKINEAVQKYNVKYVLADFRKINYNVPFSDALNLVKFYEQKLPAFSNLVGGLIISKSNLDIVKFWESICHRRGYQFKVFTNYSTGENWLTNQIVAHRLSSK